MSKLSTLLTSYQKELAEINAELSTLPEGYLVKRKTAYYHAANHKQVGITKNKELLQQLCRKKYLIARKAQLENNMAASLPTDLDNRTPHQLIVDLPKAYQLVPISYFYHPAIETWQNKSARKNQLYPEQAKYVHNNIAYRSLAERIVAEILSENGLLFQYDLTFDIGHAQVSPDFVIKNPFNNKTIICEYFGAFDQPTYGNSMNNKLDNYAKIGFIQDENLISLYEYHIREPERIQRIIDQIVW